MQPIKEVELTDVLLDLDNYRIPSSQASQDDALRYLFEAENVLDLVEKIAHDGYLDNELPLVIPAETEGKEAGQFIVLEGNRRVAALKSLKGLVDSTSHQKELNKVRKKHAHELRNLPTTIRVMVMDSRKSALPHLGRMHIGDSKRRWSRDQQATFYYSLLDEKTDVSVLHSRFPTEQNLKRLLKMASVRRFISHVGYTDTTLRAYAASADLTMSSFEYAYNKSDIAQAIGIVFNADGLIDPTPEKAGAALTGQKLIAMETLLAKFRSKELNTRSPALKKGTSEYQKLIDELNGTPPLEPSNVSGKDRADGNATGDYEAKSSGAESSDDDQPGTDTGDEPQPRSRNHPHTYPRLDMTPVERVYRDEGIPINIQTLFIELQRINIRDFPVASTMLMRATLEGTVKLALTEEECGDRNQLQQLFTVVQRKSTSENWPCKANVNSIKSGNVERHGSIQWFNLIAHDFNHHPTPESVHQAWSLVYPVIENMLTEYLGRTR